MSFPEKNGNETKTSGFRAQKVGGGDTHTHTKVNKIQALFLAFVQD